MSTQVVVFVCNVSLIYALVSSIVVFFFQAEDGIRDLVRSRGLGDVYKRQQHHCVAFKEKRIEQLPTARLRKSLPKKETVFLLLLSLIHI